MKITDAAYPYLRAQHGYVSHVESREQFEKAYKKSINMQFENIEPHLPKQVARSLDVGGGMSGIGLLLKYKFGTRLQHHVLDGIDCEPTVVEHGKPFSNALALIDFYNANDAHPVVAIAPGGVLDEMYDLVLSLAAWCFHFPPQPYLDQILDRVAEETVVILDVRRNKPEWLEELDAAFGEHKIIHRLPKLERCVWTI